MRSLIDVTKEWMNEPRFEGNSLDVAEDGKQAQCRYQANAESGNYSVFIDMDTEKQWICLYQYSKQAIPPNRRSEIAELFTRINANCKQGSLDLLMDEGRFRFRYGLDIEDSELSVAMLKKMDQLACTTLDDYAPAIAAVAYAGKTASSALASLLGQSKSPESLVTTSLADAELPTWESLPGTDCLQRWSAEIKEAIAHDASADNWEILGRGVVIAHNNMKRAESIVKRIACDAGMAFVSIPDDAVMSIPLNESDPYSDNAPIMIFLEPGDWMLEKAEKDADEEDIATRSDFRKKLVSYMKEFDPAKPVIFATAAYEIDDLAESLRVVGAFDRRFFVPKWSHEQIGRKFLEDIGLALCGDSLTGATAKVGKLISGHNSERAKSLAALAMKRLSRQVNRPLTFLDLIDFGARGTVESDKAPLDDEPIRRQVAYHEAGHALVAVLDSGGRNIPEYSTIMEGISFKGMVIESYGYLHSLESQSTYRNFLHQVRIALAGRAAEQVFAGSANVSVGAINDLEEATRYATQAFSKYGFAPGMDDSANAGSNLAIVFGTPTPSEHAHVESLTRSFLAGEYRNVVDLISGHRDMLDSIATHLLTDPILDQADLISICAEHNVAVAAL